MTVADLTHDDLPEPITGPVSLNFIEPLSLYAGLGVSAMLASPAWKDVAADSALRALGGTLLRTVCLPGTRVIGLARRARAEGLAVGLDWPLPSTNPVYRLPPELVMPLREGVSVAARKLKALGPPLTSRRPGARALRSCEDLTALLDHTLLPAPPPRTLSPQDFNAWWRFLAAMAAVSAAPVVTIGAPRRPRLVRENGAPRLVLVSGQSAGPSSFTCSTSPYDPPPLAS